MTSYSLHEDKEGTIYFWTDDKELKSEVKDVVQLIVDGVAWRNRIERVALRMMEEEEDEE